MEKFDIKKARLVSITIGICLIFVLVVANAYKYIPEEDYTNRTTQNIMNNSLKETNIETSENDNLEHFIEEENDEDTSDVNIVDNNENSLNLETQSNNYDEQIEDILKNAYKLSQEKKYNSAIYEYEKALKLSNNRIDETICYDNLTLIYAVQNRYNKALEMAEKSYSILPNSNREFVIAKLHYKMGNIQKSDLITRDILNREFSINDK